MRFGLPWRKPSGRRRPASRPGGAYRSVSRPPAARQASRSGSARTGGRREPRGGALAALASGLRRAWAGRSFALGAVSALRIRPDRGRRRPLGRDRMRLFTATRAAALLGLLGSLALGYGAVTSSAFDLSTTQLPTLRWTARAAVAAAVQVPARANVFRIATSPIEARLRDLPAVASAHVRVALPDRLVVDVVERTPILAWGVGETLFLVDRDGHLFALGTPEVVAAAKLPILTDGRLASRAGLSVGGVLSSVDLDAATRLAALGPKDVGSTAPRLEVSITDQNGFVLHAPDAWTAIFGFYTPTRRTPELIPGQVRLLRSLLDGREGGVAQVILADDRNGTYVPKPTPKLAP